ncbi:MAG TPA: copper ion binding protein [Spirochaetota bacterium]|nr:copper ion binding protein [Spirochaetota bacterium]
MKREKISIEGMSCGHCVMAIENALGKLPGISDVRVDLKTNSADVEFDDTAISINQIFDEIDNQGYNARR